MSTGALTSPIRHPLQGVFDPPRLTIIQQALAILRSYGADAHIYLPGVGTVNGITAGSATGTSPAY